VVLYTCGQKKRAGNLGHPCGMAAKALDKAGLDYEIKAVKGYRFMPWTRPSRKTDRAEITAMSGTPEVPILLLDDGEVISGSGSIARWAREHART
jgi:glutathione S-transferase